MLCSPEELLQKNQALSRTWQRYLAEPSFESFVELAVSINSFTEFLIEEFGDAPPWERGLPC